MSSAGCPTPTDLSAYAHGKLFGEALKRVAAHVPDCSPCQAALQRLAAVTDPVGAKPSTGDLPFFFDTVGEEVPPSAPAATDVTTQIGSLPTLSPPPDHAAAEVFTFLAPAERADEIGRLGSYRVLKLLGQGGMGAVFEADDPHLERRVALKVMLPAMAAVRAARERFLREARAVAALEHDHIVTVYQVGEDRGVPYLAMQLLRGMTLEDWLRQRRQAKDPGPVPVAEILRLGREIARGLAAAHERGLIHRDIKPANIWLDASCENRVKLLDFGLARPVATDVQLTQSGIVVGTPSYMAPEQASGAAMDGRADLFSLGCVLYILCTGRMPFQGQSAMSVLLALATQTPPAPQSINPEVPPALADLVMQLLAKNPADRPPSARAVAEAIGALERGQTQSALAAETQPLAAPSAVPSRRRWLLVVTVIAFLAALTAGTITYIQHQRGLQTGLVSLFDPPGPSPEPVKQADKSEPAPAPIVLLPKPPEGFEALFNGKDLSGWTVYNGSTDSWSVAEGILSTRGLDHGWLMTREEYSNFDLQLSFRVARRAASGIVVRAPLQGDLNQTGVKIQILDDHWRQEPGNGTPPSLNRLTGAIWDVKAASQSNTRPVGEWNHLRILANNRRLTVFLNRAQVQQIGLDDLRGDADRHPGLWRAGGHLGLQSNTGRVDYRNIYVKHLRPPAPRPVDTTWLEIVRKQPAATQVEMVVDKLKTLNPGFPGLEVPAEIDGADVVGFRFSTDRVSDLSPLQALARLRRLNCAGSKADKGKLQTLEPIRDLKLVELNCRNNQLTDLKALRDMPLTDVGLRNNPVVDLSPLKGKDLHTLSIFGTKVRDLAGLNLRGLRELWCNKAPLTSLAPLRAASKLATLSCDASLAERDATVLRTLGQLKTINDKPRDVFLKSDGRSPSKKK
jgi:serine/threonine protein kinase